MPATAPAPRRRLQRGITLIDGLVGTAVVAVAAGATLPGVSGLRTLHQVAHAAAEFETDVQHARSLAVAANATVRISFDSRDGASCYTVHTGVAGDCQCRAGGPALCSDGVQALRTATFAPDAAVTMSANVRTIAFDPVKGASTPTGTVRLTGRNGAAVHQIVNVMGRVRSCSPARTVPGYKAC